MPPKKNNLSKTPAGMTSAEARQEELGAIEDMALNDGMVRNAITKYKANPNPIKLEFLETLLLSYLAKWEEHLGAKEIVSIIDQIGKTRERIHKAEQNSVAYKAETAFRSLAQRVIQRWVIVLQSYMDEDEIMKFLEEVSDETQTIVDQARDEMTKKDGGQVTPATVVSLGSAAKPGASRGAQTKKSQARTKRRAVGGGLPEDSALFEED